jgi:hypothetical protein
MICWWAGGTTASVPRIAASAAMAASCRSRARRSGRSSVTHLHSLGIKQNTPVDRVTENSRSPKPHTEYAI